MFTILFGKMKLFVHQANTKHTSYIVTMLDYNFETVEDKRKFNKAKLNAFEWNAISWSMNLFQS